MDRDSGPPTKYPIAAVLRALDIPSGITPDKIKAITTLANLFVIVIRTLIDKGILGESFLERDEMDLDHIQYVISQMGGDL